MNRFFVARRGIAYWVTLRRPGLANKLAAGPFDDKVTATRTAAALEGLTAPPNEAPTASEESRPDRRQRDLFA